MKTWQFTVLIMIVVICSTVLFIKINKAELKTNESMIQIELIKNHIEMIDYSLEDLKREQALMVDEIRELN